MESQQILSGFCLKSSIVPSSPIVKQPFSLKFSSLPSFLYPSIQSQNLEVPSGTFSPISIVHKEGCSSSWRTICCSRSSTTEPMEGHEVRAHITVRRKKLAVFVSGGGSNFRSIHEASKRGSLHGDVLVLVTNKSECGGAEYARNNGIPIILFPKAKDEPNGLSPNDLVDTLRKFEVDFILLAGFLKLIPVELIRAYERSIFNIHPSLLPAFGGKGYYGMKVHKAVIASGVRFSGPTIHFVDEHYDTGHILAQRVVPVLADDTAEELAARVLKEEHQLYVEVVEALCEERVVWREDGVPLIQSKENPNEFH
ncbi:phosphoribosylglycinamide formyltransferase, chloroplastic-like [Abrus precatorius]|uniref:Phosphoribosylglycinamide formyltransferase, chloroplastic n=1 Tax=Abrus precatorius TaxID=3816 RepID=A0A8B8JSC1_ABRPR|nr:phosphoribosylglycinamide formyltransferase, chloroplastic-like [Abrus precatorius]XP_027334345.1 phosphoribosylglycinamide formyltransferase, chloroplastic-like [Abrus precatorius]